MLHRLSLALLPILTILVVPPPGPAPTAPGHPPRRLEDFREIAGYASWREATARPHKVWPEISERCLYLPHPGEVPAGGRDHLIRVFANPLAFPLLKSTRATFPAGAAIAKVKLVEGSEIPTGVAFMVKGRHGSNPAGRDWEYFLFAGQPLRLTARGALAECQSCHNGREETDGVFRSYLSAEPGRASHGRPSGGG